MEHYLQYRHKMGLIDFDEYAGHYKENNGIPFTIAGNAGAVARPGSTYKVQLPVGSNPTLAASLYASSLGENNPFLTPFQVDNAPSAYYVMAARINPSVIAAGSYTLCDRLTHTGTLDGTLTTEQTTNLPTAPLPRFTDGKGVLMALEIYSTLGTSITTATVKYTNSDGVSGQVSPPFQIGGTGFRETNRLLLIPFQSGDSGVRSVESVTLAGSTGAVGNFGVTLFKPLSIFCINNSDGPNICDPIGGGQIGTLVGIDPNSYLFFLTIGNSATVTSSGFIFICDGNT